MKITESVAKDILGDIYGEIPVPVEYVTRKEKKEYTIFLRDNLGIFLIDNTGYKFLKEIDGVKNCHQIAKAISSSTKLPYLVCCNLLVRYINFFVSLNIISSKTFGSEKFKLKESPDSVPSAPDQIAVLLTNECNLRCSHCGNENRDKKAHELSKEEWFKITDQCADMGVFVFNASGGEPFVRKDWYEILSYARSKGIEVAITSNSTLINKDIVKKLKELDIFNIHLSLDGVGEVHDYFRNRKGVFDSVVNAMSLLKKRKVPFGVTTAISKRNFGNLDELAEFINKNHIQSWEIFWALPLGCMNKIETLSPKEMVIMAEKISDFRKNLKNTKIFVGDNLGYFDRCNTQENWRGCRAGLSICAIDSEGKVKGCPIHPNCLIAGDLREKTLREIWDDKDAFWYNRNRKSKLKKQCGKCKFGKICRGGCKASMYSQHKSFEYNDYCLKFIEESEKVA